jgi:hypothetical protein
MAEAPITELVLSPRWAVSVGDIDGTPHVILRIHHPRLGPLDLLLPDNDAIELAAALEKTWERRDERRLHGAAPRTQEAARHTEELEPVRLGRAPSWWSRLVRPDPRVSTKVVADGTPAERRKSRDAG